MADSGVAGRRVVSPTLVGREKELRHIVAAVAAPPAVVVISGEAGIGKTRLVSELATRDELTAYRVFVGRCHHIRESFPLGPVIDALRGVGEYLDRSSLSALTGVLRPLLPEASEVLPPSPEPLDDRGAERHRVFRALVEVLTSAAPTVLVLEDLHWADDQTIDFVGYVLAEAPAGLAIVLTYRDEDADPALRALTAALPQAMTRTDVALDLLNVQQTGALAASIVGADDVSGEFASYLRERTSGLPFAIEELLALLQVRGSLMRRGGRWARRTLDELNVPSGIRDSVLERVDRLSGDAKAVVEAAAVLQTAVAVDVLVATCRAEGDHALSALDDALASGLLVDVAGKVGFRHVLAAQAVYEDMPGTRRRDLHGRAAVALKETWPAPLGQIAHHYQHAGRMAEWVDAAEAAAEQAFDLGDDGEAFRLLEGVLLQADLDPRRRARLAVRLCQAAIEALHASEVVNLVETALDPALPESLRGELRFHIGMLLHEAGSDPPRVRRLLIDAVGELADRPDLRAWAMVVLGIPADETVTLDEHRKWLQRALDVVPTIGDPVFEVFLLGKVAMLLVPFGDRRWHELIDLITERTNGSPRQRREVNAYWSVGTQLSYAGHHVPARRLLNTALEGAGASENTRLELSVRSGIALLDYLSGSWDQLADVRELVQSLASHPRAGIDAEVAAACWRLATGELHGGHDDLDDAVRHCLELGAFDVLPIAAQASIRLKLARGDGDSAVTLADRLYAAADSKGLWAPDVRAVPGIVEALARGGRGADAAAYVSLCEERLADLDAPLAAAALSHARGTLTHMAGDHREAAAEFAAAARMFGELTCPYESALAHEHAALALDGAGDASGARAAVQAALSEFRRLGANWDISRVTQLARQWGMSIPRHHRGGRHSYGNELSPREREVAALAALGRSNKEIAAELYLSVNTVARHVSAAMRKLDVRSRTALARRLTDEHG